MNPVELPSPAELSACARAREITSILAAVIVRSLAPDIKNKSDVGLGFLPHQSVHTTPYPQEKL